MTIHKIRHSLHSQTSKSKETARKWDKRKEGSVNFFFFFKKGPQNMKCFHFEVFEQHQEREESEVTREDRNMELSIRRKRQSDGEGVRTEREN